jgi:hypothetical protein
MAAFLLFWPSEMMGGANLFPDNVQFKMLRNTLLCCDHARLSPPHNRQHESHDLVPGPQHSVPVFQGGSRVGEPRLSAKRHLCPVGRAQPFSSHQHSIYASRSRTPPAFFDVTRHRNCLVARGYLKPERRQDQPRARVPLTTSSATRSAERGRCDTHSAFAGGPQHSAQNLSSKGGGSSGEGVRDRIGSARAARPSVSPDGGTSGAPEIGAFS